MSGNTDTEKAKNPGIEAIISDDKRTVEIRFARHEGTVSFLAVDAISVDALIAHFETVRRQMDEPIPFNISFDNPRILAAFDPPWHILPDTNNQYATFWVRHPGLGWSGYGFPRHEAANIAQWLRKITKITDTRDTQSPAATSIGNDRFLISTEGLGFYYYGAGETRIGPNPFEQVEFDSDRAAGIVAGSIAERRLEQAIRSKLRSDKSDVARNLFRPSGALGSFSNKIQLALLMGLLTEEAYEDLANLKDIRNAFAHDLDLDAFDRPSIRDRCKNFILVDRHIGPVPDATKHEISTTERPNPYMGLPDYQKKLSDPRFRYMMTAQLISFSLGLGADHADKSLPFV